MKELITIFKNIKDEFCSLWTFKERGETLEIITPFATTSNKFVSVFLTVKNKEFIISDGGWLSDSTYETTPDFEDDVFNKVFAYYKNFYDIKSIKANELEYYFKKTEKKELIPNLVFDIANFVSAISSSSQIQFIDIKEKEERARFQKQASDYIKAIMPKTDKPNIHFRKYIDDKLKNIKFSAVVTHNSKLTLINYITGSTPDYFISSIGKANIYFEVVNKSTYKNHIQKKVALINDTATGYNKEKLFDVLEQLENTTKKNNILWHQKEKLKTLI